MESSYLFLMLLKIIVSTGLMFNQVGYARGAALMGGHVDNNTNYTTTADTLYDEYDYDSAEVPAEKTATIKTKTDSEEIPDPSPLVLPGYNLPENIFNHGKPFYVEKDPVSGKINFDHKSPSMKSDESDQYDYVNEEPTGNIYDKKNIDRKDGSLGGYGTHKQADVNQLTPNFHDFLNLPVKYNPNKYVYPLISSSYASTKIQGSVNKYHNHKDTFGVQKITTTQKPTSYSTSKTYYTPRTSQRTIATTQVTTTTTKPTTIKRYPELTTTPENVLHAGMSHPSFSEEYEYYDSPSGTTIIPTTTTNKHKPQDIYLTTTIKPAITTTKKVMSLFEQLFGDYEDVQAVTQPSEPPKLFSNLPTTTTTTTTTTTKPIISITTQASYPNIHAGPDTNILTGSNMGLESSYEYEDEDYSNEKVADNIAVENKLQESLSVEPLRTVTKLTPVNKTIYEDKTKKPTLDLNKNKPFSVKPTSYGDYFTEKTKPSTSTTSTSTRATTTTTTTPTMTTTTQKPTITSTRVTSLPLGENHINTPSLNRDPIIVATQNLREKLNSEKVKPIETPQLVVELPPQPQSQQSAITQLAPSSSNIHIAPGQDTVSFVVGHHQSVGDNGQYVGTSIKDTSFDNRPFRPLYQQEVTKTPQFNLRPPQPPDVAGSAVTIQPLQNSEASLAIGRPVNGIKQVPGQVMDASLDHNGAHIQFPKGESTKVVFPEESKKHVQTNLIQPKTELNKEVLKLNSGPMYHQLPSDLTPPKEQDVPPRYGPSDRPVRPPWDPRPGHFYSGKPEYARPPRPPPEIAYKRIDNLPNILPQFRPNMKHRYSMGPPPYLYDQRLNRQPLLERPANRPIGFFEKIGPPPPPNLYKRFPPQQHPLPKNAIRHPLAATTQERKPNFDIEERRPLAQQPPQSLEENQNTVAEDRIMNEEPRRPDGTPELNIYQTPPNIHIANRRNGDAEVETLQMIQAKNEKEKEDEEVKGDTVKVIAQDPKKESEVDKTIYKVYPVNTAPLIDADQKEDSTVYNNDKQTSIDFNFKQQDRNDAPILKPHPRPPTFPVKTDFPYPLERPDSIRTPDAANNKLDDNFNNKWSSVGENLESRIVTGGKVNHASNQISATLKTYTEKPIAIAYTPTQPNLNADKYSMPNYGSPVIPEIRPGTVENADTGYGSKQSEFTVHATMHTNPNFKIPSGLNNHRIDLNTQPDTAPPPPQLDFQAPFQASVKLDSLNDHGWSVVRTNNKTNSIGDETEVTTLPLATTSEFDIENFKPTLIGGFKPLYAIPEMVGKKVEEVPDREEK